MLTATLAIILLTSGWTGILALAADPATVNLTTGRGRLFVSSFMTMHDPFFMDLNEGLKNTVESHGDRFILLDGEHSREKQEKDIIEVLKQKPSAIFLVPATDVGSTDGILAAAKRQNVPVIIVDTDLSGPDLALCQVVTDNIGAGRLACKELARVNPAAKIGVLRKDIRVPVKLVTKANADQFLK